jgi:hypothetical protein
LHTLHSLVGVVTRIRWSAGKDGRAHAHVSGRTLCRVQSISERDAWPTLTRCPRCVAMTRDLADTTHGTARVTHDKAETR